jgi:ATP-dependent DNA ligase
MEGTIVKDPAKPYASGKRGHGWTKFKANDEMDVVIMGYKMGENSFTGLIGAIEFGQYQEQDSCPACSNDPAGQRWLCSNRPHPMVLTPRGRCSGMDMKKRKEISADPEKFVGQVISLAYMGIMPSGSPRHPQYKRFRPDKPAKDCTWTT